MTAHDFSSEQFQQTIHEMSELAGGLAHELRNPLSTMMVNLKLLAEDLQDAAIDSTDLRRRSLIKVETLRREADRLQSLFDDFLRLVGPSDVTPRETDLSQIVRRLLEFFEPLALNLGIAVRVMGTDEPHMAVVDDNLLSQALFNIVINAQQALPQGGTIDITLSKTTQASVISVRDNGVGMTQEDCERIFKPFFSTKKSGTGLGLSMTQRIVRDHGGSIKVTSQPGQGTTFTIALPRTQSNMSS